MEGMGRKRLTEDQRHERLVLYVDRAEREAVKQFLDYMRAKSHLPTEPFSLGGMMKRREEILRGTTLDAVGPTLGGIGKVTEETPCREK